jgi:hypothetical protein
MEKRIESVVLTELHGTYGLDSLRIQNHLYGCFIVMEDIVESVVEWKNKIGLGEGYELDVEEQFSEIGIRFGFLMDMKLEWTTYSAEYKEAWMMCFAELAVLRDIKKVEQLEDVLLEAVKKTVRKEDAYLMHSLDTGMLSRVWMDKVIRLLRGSEDHSEVVSKKEEQLMVPVKEDKVEKQDGSEVESQKETERMESHESNESNSSEENEQSQENTVLTRAHVEKRMGERKMGLHRTRRNRIREERRNKVSKTRRHHKGA